MDKGYALTLLNQTALLGAPIYSEKLNGRLLSPTRRLGDGERQLTGYILISNYGIRGPFAGSTRIILEYY